MKKLLVVFLIASLFEVGCFIPAIKYFGFVKGGPDVSENPVFILPTEPPKIFEGTNNRNDRIAMFEQGYDVLGYSSFNGRDINEKILIEQAETAKAAVVLYYKGNIFDADKASSLEETSVVPIDGRNAKNVPHFEAGKEYFASYWILIKSLPLGVKVIDIPSDLTKKTGTHSGTLIEAVVKNSPAQKARFLMGDIIKKINGVEITDTEMAIDLIKANVGKSIDVVLLRDGKTIQDQVSLNPATSFMQENMANLEADNYFL